LSSAALVPSRSRVIAFALSLAAVLVLAEIAARVAGFGEPPLVILDDEIEYYLVPHREYHRFGKTYRINGHSMRSDDIGGANGSPGSTFAILGDSVVYGPGIDQDATVAKRLQNMLRARRPPPAEAIAHGSARGGDIHVLSIAASSWGPENILAFYRRFGPFSGNTAWIVQSSHDMADVMRRPSEPPPYRSAPPMGALHDALSGVVGAIAARLRPATLPAADDAADRAHAEAALVGLIERLKKDYGRVVLVFHATKHEALSKVSEGDTHFRRIAGRTGIDYLSMLGPYSAAYQAGTPPHFDDIHLNESGARLLARLLNASMDTARSGNRH